MDRQLRPDGIKYHAIFSCLSVLKYLTNTYDRSRSIVQLHVLNKRVFNIATPYKQKPYIIATNLYGIMVTSGRRRMSTGRDLTII